MAQHNETEKKGEEMTALYLIKIGFSIVAHNFKYKGSDIDLDICFDIVAITIPPYKINHIENAFYPLI